MTKHETAAHHAVTNGLAVLTLLGELLGTVLIKVIMWPVLMVTYIKLKLMPNMNKTAEQVYDAAGLLINGAWLYFLFIATLAGVKG